MGKHSPRDVCGWYLHLSLIWAQVTTRGLYIVAAVGEFDRETLPFWQDKSRGQLALGPGVFTSSPGIFVFLMFHAVLQDAM